MLTYDLVILTSLLGYLESKWEDGSFDIVIILIL